MNTAQEQSPRWNLSDLYQSIHDPQIAMDVAAALGAAKHFEISYKGRIHAEDVASPFIQEAMRRREAIEEAVAKLRAYADLVFAADTKNPKNGAFLQKIRENTTEIRKHLIFFDLEWVSLSDEIAKRLLDEEALSAYRHTLAQRRKYKPHTLSEPEEKILRETENTGSKAFSRLFGEVMNNIVFSIRIDGKTKKMNEAEAFAFLYDADRKKRKAAWRGITKGLKENSHVLKYIFNVLLQDHAMTDRLRSFDHPTASRHLDNQIDKATVDVLLATLEDNYDIVHSYYALKKDFLGLRKLRDYDRYAPFAEDTKRISYEGAKDIILGAYGKFSARMAEIAGLFFDNNWIDVGIREGKQGGAFSHSTVPSVHPYILINYGGNLSDVMVLAHELGHGIHQYLSRKQGHFQANPPLTISETASVFSEMLVFHDLKAKEKDPYLRFALLASKIEDIFATVFRQGAMTRFEENLHHARRKEGELEIKQINHMWLEANKAMFGDSVEMTDEYGLWWIYIPHFLHSPFFYCYAYSFGELLVLALYHKYLNEGAGFVSRYLDLLAAGGSDSPNNLISKVGFDITDPRFWQGGIDIIRDMVREAEELWDGINLSTKLEASKK
ncbi:MAG: M3 family oligoendopeptidase [Candidatus Niyogibacteria bacterium]|nr:M3 family oligoendopeptidase [Candidatus Niyogibacteria bacterium]